MNLVKALTGTVTLDINDYNDLIRKAQRFDEWQHEREEAIHREAERLAPQRKGETRDDHFSRVWEARKGLVAHWKAGKRP